MANLIDIDPSQIQPSQDFLKDSTVAYIFRCIQENREEDLPPTPIVRRDGDNIVAIDGHNLLAVRSYLGHTQKVHVAANAHDGLPPINVMNNDRNHDLLEKYEMVLGERDKARLQGILTISDLVQSRQNLFTQLHLNGKSQ